MVPSGKSTSLRERFNIGPLEDVAEEGPGRLRVVGINEGVDTSDHALKVARSPPSGQSPGQPKRP